MKTLCVTQFSDAPLDPKDSVLFRDFANHLANYICSWVVRDSKQVLVVCEQGRNRSALVCALAHQIILGCSFGESLKCLHSKAEEAHHCGSEEVPTRFLSSQGGEYFQVMFGQCCGRDARIGKQAFGENRPYLLEVHKHGNGGSLWIGNYKGLLKESLSPKFDISVNLSGRDRQSADHWCRWKTFIRSSKMNHHEDLFGNAVGSKALYSCAACMGQHDWCETTQCHDCGQNFCSWCSQWYDINSDQVCDSCVLGDTGL